jgi:membrane fusion protein (multidrug efflux system)
LFNDFATPIDNKSNQLLPGMFAKAIIPIQRKEPTVVVPQSAVVTNMEHCFLIRIEKQNKAVWVDVQKGELQGDEVEVFGKITPGHTILNVASDEIKNGQDLRIILVDRKNRH